MTGTHSTTISDILDARCHLPDLVTRLAVGVRKQLVLAAPKAAAHRNHERRLPFVDSVVAVGASR